MSLSRLRRTPTPRLPIILSLSLLLGLSVVAGCSSNKAASSSSTSTTQAAGSSGPHATPGNEAFCQSYYDAVLKVNKDIVAAAQGTDAAAVAALVPELKAIYQQLTDTAPASIKADFESVNTVTQQAKVIKDLAAASLTGEPAAARSRITTWSKTDCGFDPTHIANS